jgi:hypothetical protein
VWRVLPFQWLVGYFLFGIALVFVLVWRLQGKPKYLKGPAGKGLLRLFGTLWTTVTVFTLVTVLAGKFMWTPMARVGWFSDRVFADVGGDWQGSLHGAGGAPGDWVDVHIEQDFFELEITFTASGARRTDSRTIAVWPERESGSRRQRLWYVYETRPRDVPPGDATVFQGAGFVEVRKGRGGLQLEGLYWTNRNWQHDAQTAGQIRLRRAGATRPGPLLDWTAPPA